MTVTVLQQQQVVAEATEILFTQMSRAKIALLLSTWHQGKGNYLKLREQLFGNETVTSLAEKIQAYETHQETSYDAEQHA